MASITLLNTNTTIKTSPAISILNSLLREGIFINHLCGGKAGCGTCQIKIISGHKYLSKKTEREKLRLVKVKAQKDIRLACQCHTFGDITIAIRFKKASIKH
ncbi:2Fe-2S iron-sulfur cluster-binding protein [Spirochaeta cellobiosiphila]|uniref:2Fe-2S iron-sulfur cluster-binding protein n=1 Tax=Spirochaeta cellobiosiphila TaxID=504483 RepID=UPI0004921D14|nr:2Fe-2S iron-sulfur cluster-binding protein [Spirochaeta cellobiosiphila]